MNTPDHAPKDGDFVAYLEELERRQLRSSPPATHAGMIAAAGKTPASAAISAANPASIVATVAALKAIPMGLIAIGLVLIIAGAAFDGGIFLVALGVVLLWQAARSMIRSARAATEEGKTQAVQQVATLLATRAPRDKAKAK